MPFKQTKEKVGSAGKKSVFIRNSRAGSSAAPKESESNPSNIITSDSMAVVPKKIEKVSGQQGYRSGEIKTSSSNVQSTPRYNERQAIAAIEFQNNLSINPKMSIRQDTPEGRVEMLRQSSNLISYEEKKVSKQPISYSEPDKFSGMRGRIEKLEERDTKFFNSEGFQNIKEVANKLTQPQRLERIKEVPSGRLLPGFFVDVPAREPIQYEDRSFGGKTIELTARGMMSAPIAIGGIIPSAGGKVAAFSEALFYSETRKNIPGELKRSAIQTREIMNPFKPEGASILLSSAIVASTILPNTRTSFPVRSAMKTLYKNKYVPIEDTGINYVEGVTIPKTLGELRAFEGKKATTIHTSPQDIFKGEPEVLLTSQPKAGKFRQKYELYNFYKSSPSKPNQFELIKNTPPPQTKFPASVWDFAYEPGKPNAYLGYLGITKGEPAVSSGKVLYLKPVAQIYIGEDVISKTPSFLLRKDVRTINRFQTQKSGETQVPAENLARLSTEGQFTTPAKYENVPNYPSTPGSILARKGETQFTYYTQVKENPYTNPVSKSLWNVFARKTDTFKFEITPVETKPIEGTIINLRELNVPKYNEGYGETSIISPKSTVLSSGMKSVTGSYPQFDQVKSNSVSTSIYSKGTISYPSSIPIGRSVSSSIIPSSKSKEVISSPQPSSRPRARSSPGISSPVPSIPPSSPPPSSPPHSYFPSSIPSVRSISSPRTNRAGRPTDKPSQAFPGIETRDEGGFDVFVRKRGKFRKINKAPLIEKEARKVRKFQCSKIHCKSILPVSFPLEKL